MSDRIELAPGLVYIPDFFDPDGQQNLIAAIQDVIRQAPLFTPRMPRTGKPFSVRMSNCGVLGWMSDAKGGYRYEPAHPQTQSPWPPIPDGVLQAWRDASGCRALPEACLINWYDPGARMGLHQDRDEQALDAPVVSISLGADCLFRFGGVERRAPTRSLRLRSGDIVVIGGAARLCFHGVDRIYPGTSQLVEGGGRINLTLRRVLPLDNRAA